MGNGIAMNPEVMKDRTKNFAKQIILLCRKLPKNREGNLIGNQIFRSGTSVASNYRAACRARSKAEFIAKMGIVEEEADETLFWLEVIAEVEIFNKDSISSLMQECNENFINSGIINKHGPKKKVRLCKKSINSN